jgi:hypothetical protein
MTMTDLAASPNPGPIRRLVDDCIAGDPEAWSGLWRIVEGAVRGASWKTLRFVDADRSLVDDLGQELFLHLRADDSGRLRRFRGSTVGELRAFVRVTAARMSFQRLRRWRHARSRESAAARQAHGSALAGPTVAQIEMALRDLEASMSRSDRDRLHWLRDSGGVGPCCPRSFRRLSQDLVLRYGDRVV